MEYNYIQLKADIFKYYNDNFDDNGTKIMIRQLFHY